ncbi:MAG TPA: hypothetical protein VHM16_06460, partial [Rubrobacteraceae bacterium]|nr:hypothetical protein [Rubrobacteraceae bacterium]
MRPLSEAGVGTRVEAPPGGGVPGRSRSRGSRWARLPKVVRYGILALAMLGIWQAYVSVSGVQPLVLP